MWYWKSNRIGRRAIVRNTILHVNIESPERGEKENRDSALLTNHRYTRAHSYFELDPHSRHPPTNFAFLVLLSRAKSLVEKDRLIE